MGALSYTPNSPRKTGRLRSFAQACAYGLIGTMGVLFRGRRYFVFLATVEAQHLALGLIVIDEEHRFGVKHKERLKELRLETDVLTLTATPIPRTLHMSFAGIRDLSIASIELPLGLALMGFGLIFGSWQWWVSAHSGTLASAGTNERRVSWMAAGSSWSCCSICSAAKSSSPRISKAAPGRCN